VSTDTIIVRGAGDYATTTLASATSYYSNKVYPYRTTLTAALASHGAATNRTRSATDKIVDLSLTGTSYGNAYLRASITVNDEATTTYWSTSIDPIYATTTLTASSAQQIDGDNSILLFGSSTLVATTTWAVANFGDITGYSKLSFWVYPSTSTANAFEVFVTSTNGSTTAYVSSSATSSLGTLDKNAWNYVTKDISTDLSGITSSDTYLGIAWKAPASSTETIYIDNIRAYNDSITVDISGDATTCTTTVNGLKFTLQNTDGTEKALGYYDLANAQAVFIPTVEIKTGSDALTLEMVTNSNTLMKKDVSGVKEILSLSSDLYGTTRDSAGDFRWYDLAIAATTPITWLNGASPISITLDY